MTKTAAGWYTSCMKRYAVLSMGEPAGTSPEMIMKAVREYADDPSAAFITVGDEAIFRRTAKDLSLPLPFSFYVENEKELAEAEEAGEPFIFYSSSSSDVSSFSYGRVTAETGAASFEALRSAVSIIQNGLGHTLVTSPVSGKALECAGYAERSVFDMLGRFASSSRLSNMLLSGRMCIFGLTHRRALRSAIDEVRQENIISALVDIDSLRTSSSFFDRSKPIAVSSLNPMRPDGTWTGPDEEESIIPAIVTAARIGIDAVGPLQAEDLFERGVKGEFSAILVMTAGEAFAAAASASPDSTAVVTWGLPFMRIGPLMDAGLAEAGKGIARTCKLKAAMDTALRLRSASFLA